MWIVLPPLFLALAPAQEAPSSPFRALDFAQALAAAAAEERPLLVDFRDPDSAEAKTMDAMTWGDPIMRRWLDARVVPVQYDIRASAELAERLGVSKTPTTVLLTSEGAEIDRLVGVMEPRPMMAEALEILQCGARVGPARQALQRDPLDPAAHVELGLAYFGCARWHRSLDELLWAWDHGGARPEFELPRRLDLPRTFARLIKRYPAARDPLVLRRDRTQERLLAFEEGADSVALALDVGALNTALSAERKQLQLFEQLLAREGTPRQVVEASFNKLVSEHLIREKRWAQWLAGRGDVLVWLDAEYVRLARDAAAVERGEESGDPEQTEHGVLVRRNGLLFQASVAVQALCATGKPAHARDVASTVLLHDARSEAHRALVQACASAGATELAREWFVAAEKAGAEAHDLRTMREAIEAAEAAAKKR